MLSPANRLIALCGLVVLSACAGEDLSKPPEPIGDFRLGYNVVVADKAESVGPSRKATPEEWEVLIKDEVAKRLGRYEGEKLYHIGISVDAYALAIPGIPVVVSPKSVLALTVNIYDDAAGATVNAESKRFTVFERLSGETVVGSGLTQTREKQMQNLAANAARLITAWVVENKAWFTPEAAAARAEAARVAAAAPAAVAGAAGAAPAVTLAPAPVVAGN
jgi:hypothetical protein